MTNEGEAMRLKQLFAVISLLSAFVMARADGPVPQDPSSQPPGDFRSPTTFEPANQKPLNYFDETLKVTLIVGKERDSLRILRPVTKLEWKVDLPVEMAQVDEIRKSVDDKLLVRGMVNGSGSEIVVIDLRTVKQIDRFICYRPSVSPSQKYVAFIKFYPAHFAEGTVDHYMIYDVSKSPAENRSKGIPTDDWVNVGKPIYPPRIGNGPADNVDQPRGSLHDNLSDFFWNSSGTQFLFADRLNLGDDINLILVDLQEDGSAKVRIARRSIVQLCPDSGRICLPFVRNVEFHTPAEPAFSISFELVNLKRSVMLSVSSEEFHPV
jgi:hypothetical protein